MKTWRHIVAVLLWVLPALAHATTGAGLVTVVTDGGQTMIRNNLPVPIAVQLRPLAAEAVSAPLVAVVAQARGNTVVSNREEELLITRLEPLHSRVPMQPGGSRCEEARSAQPDVAAQLSALSAEQPEGPDLVNTPEAAAKVASAVALAQLDHEQRLDQLATERELVNDRPYDPLNPASFDQYMKARRDAAVNAIVGSLVSLAVLDLDSRTASEGILRDEADALDAMVVKGEEALPVMRRSLDGLRAETAAQHAFASLVDGAIAAEGVLGFAPSGPPARLCAGHVRILDQIVVTASAPLDHAVARGRICFDRGGNAPVIFRRVGTSDRWVAQIAWPPDAAGGRLTMGAGTPAFDLSPGRPPLASLVQEAEKQIASIRSQGRARRYRAHGADRFRTLIIP